MYLVCKALPTCIAAVSCDGKSIRMQECKLHSHIAQRMCEKVACRINCSRNEQEHTFSSTVCAVHAANAVLTADVMSSGRNLRCAADARQMSRQ